MKKTVAILATMDTKGAESNFIREEIQKLGGTALLMDMGVMKKPDFPVDYTQEQVAQSGGSTREDLLNNPSREKTSEVMVKGSLSLLQQLIAEGKIQALLSLGGTQGTNNATQVMQQLPYGFPKIMVSTMASGDTSAFVGIKDITMMFSVSDILGLNAFTETILANAAGAAYGMALAAKQIDFKSEKPIIGISNLGVLTQGTIKAIEMFREKGYECLVFHAIGAGGTAMEQMMKEGIIKAVFDFGMGDIADAVHEGLRAADRDRLTVAGKLGLPQVVVPGGIDHLGIILDEPNAVPDKYKNHLYSYHNPVIFVPRTNSEEITAIMKDIARRLQHAKDKTVFMLPTLGVSSYSRDGGALVDKESDKALQKAVKEFLPDSIKLIEMENNAEDEEFVRKAVDTLVELIEG